MRPLCKKERKVRRLMGLIDPHRPARTSRGLNATEMERLLGARNIENIYQTEDSYDEEETNCVRDQQYCITGTRIA